MKKISDPYLILSMLMSSIPDLAEESPRSPDEQPVSAESRHE